MKLTDTQLVLLSAALQRDDGTLALPPNLKGRAAHKVIAKLLTEGLVEEIPARGSLPVWRKDDEERPIALRITDTGLAAIKVDGDAPAADQPAREAKPTRRSSSNKKTPDAKAKRTGKGGQASQEADKPWAVQTGPGDCAPEPPPGHDDCGDHEGDRLAGAFGTWILCRCRAQEAWPKARI